MARGKRAAHKVQLREITIRKAEPADRAYLVWDAHQRGLALRVQPTGAKSWVAVYNRHGRTRWLTLGAADAIGLADARLLTARTMLAVAEGKDPAAEKQAERGAGTFADLAERYVEQYAKKHNKSWMQGAALVRRFALPKWGKLQAASIARADAKAMIARIAAPIVANQTLAALSAIFTWAVKEELVAANPCKLIDRNPTKAGDRVLSESEIPLFWTALDDVDPVRAMVLRMILLTGQRPGEVRHMRREHIIDGWWCMPGDPVKELGWPGTKNGAAHRVWLPAPARELIDIDNGGATGFVFASSRGRPVRDLGAAMRAIFTKLGAEPARPHDLRRTHGTTITKLKFGRDAMNRIQNHIDGGIADVYDQHQYGDENRHIMEAVATHIIGLVDGGGSANVVQFDRRKA